MALKNTLLKAGILAITLLILSGALLVLAFEVWEPPSISKFLPAEETIMFAEGDLEILATFLSEEERAHNAVAWVNDDTWKFIHDENKTRAVEEYPTTLSPVKRDLNFIKLRPNLPYDPLTFVYLKTNPFLEKTNLDFLDWFTFTLPESLFETFPVMGTAINPHEAGFTVQTYIVGDKTITDGEPLFHLENKYKGHLIDKMPETDLFFGGEDLRTTLEQINMIAGQVSDHVTNLLAGHFGDLDDIKESIEKLFANEYALAFYEQDWLLALELTRDTQDTLEELEELLLTQGLIEIDRETSTLTQNQITRHSEEIDGQILNTYKKEDLTVLLRTLTDGDTLFILSSNLETDLLLNTLSNNGDTFTLPIEMLSGDHVILFTTEAGDPIYSAINLFDDGISTLHLLP